VSPAILCKTMQPRVTKAEYLNQAIYSRKFTAEDIWGHKPGDPEFPELDALTVGLIEHGDTAWGVPEFEQRLKSVFYYWAAHGLIIRAQMFAQWMLATTTDPAARAWLQDYAAGQFWGHLNDYEFRCSIVGHEPDFLYPLRVDRIIYSRKYWAAYRAGQKVTLRLPSYMDLTAGDQDDDDDDEV
jgi:hypothetical protein